MAKCDRCGKRFNVAEARDEYNAEFDGEIDYDEVTDGTVCADCAIPETESNISVGRAIDMMNGEEAHDQDFVDRWL